MAIRRTKKGIRGDTRGLAYREDYTPYGISRGKVGKIQYYEQDESGRFRKINPYELPTVQGQVPTMLYPTAGGSYKQKRDWFRDIQILGSLAIIAVTSIIAYFLLGAVFDYMIAFDTFLGIGAPLAGLRTQAQLLLTVAIGLMLGGGISLFLFRQDELNDEPYIGGDEY